MTDERSAHAIAPVLGDVDAVLGPGAVRVRPDGPGDVVATVSVRGEPGSIGILDVYADPADLVVAIAEAVQEVVMMSERFRGTPFPPCPEHPNHPLWPDADAGDAVWRCSEHAGSTVAIGSYRTGGAR